MSSYRAIFITATFIHTLLAICPNALSVGINNIFTLPEHYLIQFSSFPRCCFGGTLFGKLRIPKSHKYTKQDTTIYLSIFLIPTIIIQQHFHQHQQCTPTQICINSVRRAFHIFRDFPLCSLIPCLLLSASQRANSKQLG